MSIRLIRRPEVVRRTGLGEDALRQAVREGIFPSPVKIGLQAQAWVLSEVESWISQRIVDRDQGQSNASKPGALKAVDHIPPGCRVLPRAEVLQRTGKSSAALYSDIKHHRFPPPINIGTRRTGWLESEVNSWIAERLTERGVKPSERRASK